MSWSIQLAGTFKKRYAKLEPAERDLVDDKLRILAANPWHPSLRVKKIRGSGEFEASVNMDIRLAFCLEDGKIIVMLDVGHHDDLLRRRTRR